VAEATPPDWRDTCERCGRGFAPGEPRWLEQQRYFVHTECARWELWETPPYAWKLKELRTQYREADAQSRTRIVKAGQAIRRMQMTWPKYAKAHVRCVLDAVRDLG
jgi:hypothetical protein